MEMRFLSLVIKINSFQQFLRVMPAWLTLLVLSMVGITASPALPAQPPLPSSLPVSLLDEDGNLLGVISRDTIEKWKQELHGGMVSPVEAAWRQLWLGEIKLTRDQEPRKALHHFRIAQKTTPRSERVHGLAAYDTAIGLFHIGAYERSAAAFRALLLPKTALKGYRRQTVALWYKHVTACAGYHAERAKMGITQPEELDPLCGAAGLAVCLRDLGLPHSKLTVLKSVRVTGRGSSLQDLVNAGKKLGVVTRVVSADRDGLIALPKPLVAFVEHDHFIAVTKADRKGVEYICSDCGAWPGGRRQITWKQWQMMEASVFLTVVKPGSVWDKALSLVLSQKQGTEKHGWARFASRRWQGVAEHARLAARLTGHVVLFEALNLYCGFTPSARKCHPFQCCPMDGPPCGGGPYRGFGPSAPDPVNLATGEEEYTPPPDLVVYNPNGPPVVWGRLYNSLRGFDTAYYNYFDLGVGWSYSYNAGVYDTQASRESEGSLSAAEQAESGSALVAPGTRFVFFPNGSRVSFTIPALPTPANPIVACTVPPGFPFSMIMQYVDGTYYYTITFADRSKWITIGSSNQSVRMPIGQIIDKCGNALNFIYDSSRRLTAIKDKNNSTLLTIVRNAGSGTISRVDDAYGRSVYYTTQGFTAYHIYPGGNQTQMELATVSQIVIIPPGI